VHADSASPHIPSEKVEQKFLSPLALTTAALGMVFESEGFEDSHRWAPGVKKIG
jgi:hypothetical protein